MTVYFTADLHLGHKRIIEHSERPFDTVLLMNEALVENWRTRVRPGDLVYCLGDFSFEKPETACESARQLSGNKYLIFGNHDKTLRKNAAFLAHWIWARDYAEIEVEGQKIVLSHYAFRTWNGSHRGAWNLHGHSHGSLLDDPHALQLDVGVDCWDYAPVSFAELRERMSTKTFRPVDHHGRVDE